MARDSGQTFDLHHFLGSLWIATSALPEDGFGLFQAVFLLTVYSYLAFRSAGLILHGCHFLLLVPEWENAAAALLIPLLDILPEAVVLNAARSLEIRHVTKAIGTYVALSLFSLFIPLFIVVCWGRVDIELVTAEEKTTWQQRWTVQSVCTYTRPMRAGPGWRQLSRHHRFSFLRSGIEFYGPVGRNAGVLLLSVIPHCILLSGLVSRVLGDRCPSLLQSFARSETVLAALVCAVVGVIHIGMNVFRAGSRDQLLKARLHEIRLRAIQAKRVPLRDLLKRIAREMLRPEKTADGMGRGEEEEEEGLIQRSPSARRISKLLQEEETRQEVTELLRPFFLRLDADNSGELDSAEVAALLHELGMRPSVEGVTAFMRAADVDASRTITLPEFVVALLLWASGGLSLKNAGMCTQQQQGTGQQQQQLGKKADETSERPRRRAGVQFGEDGARVEGERKVCALDDLKALRRVGRVRVVENSHRSYGSSSSSASSSSSYSGSGSVSAGGPASASATVPRRGSSSSAAAFPPPSPPEFGAPGAAPSTLPGPGGWRDIPLQEDEGPPVGVGRRASSEERSPSRVAGLEVPRLQSDGGGGTPNSFSPLPPPVAQPSPSLGPSDSVLGGGVKKGVHGGGSGVSSHHLEDHISPFGLGLRGILWVLAGSTGCFLLTEPALEAAWTVSRRLGAPSFFTGSIIAPFFASAARTVLMPLGHARQRTRQAHTFVVAEALGISVMHNSLLLGSLLLANLRKDTAWKYPGESLLLAVAQTLCGVHLNIRSRLTFAEGVWFLLLWAASVVALFVLSAFVDDESVFSF